jgi:hypothetical protein
MAHTNHKIICSSGMIEHFGIGEALNEIVRPTFAQLAGPIHRQWPLLGLATVETTQDEQAALHAPSLGFPHLPLHVDLPR